MKNNDEPDWEYKYQNRIGKPFGSGGSMQPFGLVALGLFQSQEEIDNSPVQSFGEYRVGDIKYQDINGDGVINSQDQIAIGYTNLPEIMYGFGATAAIVAEVPEHPTTLRLPHGGNATVLSYD